MQSICTQIPRIIVWLLWAEQCCAVPSLGDVAGRLIVGADFLTRLMLAACIAIGLTLVILSITYFRGHRFNPKLVPLGKPVIYLVLGLIVFTIPFLGKLFGETGSILDLKKKEATLESCRTDIDTPLEFGNEFDH